MLEARIDFRRFLFFMMVFLLPISLLAEGDSTALNKNEIVETEMESEGPVICKTGIYVKTIRIHEAEELFEVLFYYWVRVDSIDVNKDYSHVSNIEFVNAESESELDYDTLDVSNRMYLAIGSCKAQIPYKANFKRFPFDVQSLIISLESKVDGYDNLVYIPDNLTPPINAVEHKSIDILNGDQFFIKNLSARPSKYTYETNFGDPNIEGFDSYSRMDFIIDIDRDPKGMMQKIVLPLLVVLILAYLVFFIPDYEIGTASALTVTALLAAIAFQWTLNDDLPKVSYLTMVDKIFYLVYVYIFYAMAQTVYTFNLNKRGESLMESDPEKGGRLSALSDNIEWHSRYLFPLSFVLLLAYLIW